MYRKWPGRWPLMISDEEERSHVMYPELEQQSPILRGYWLDAEVMEISGIESASVIMKLKWADAVNPSHIAIRPKGRKRAWSARNVFRALLAAELSRLGRMSFLAAGMIVGAGLQRGLESLLKLDDRLMEIEMHLFEHGHSSTNQSPYKSSNTLRIRDWKQVLLVHESGKETPLAQIDQLDKKTPVINRAPEGISHSSSNVVLDLPIEPIFKTFLSGIEPK